MYRIPEIWLGTERSYLRLMQASEYLLEHPGMISPVLRTSPDGWNGDEGEDSDPVIELLNDLADRISFKTGTVGFVEVSGELVLDTSWWNPYFGFISYDTLVYAARKLAAQEDVTDIVLLMDSPGGAAIGVDDASRALRSIGEEVGLYTYVKGEASSAAYWLATETAAIYGPRMSQVGSIGALIEYISVARRMKEAGVDVKIVRAGEYKAIGHPHEPISQKAIEVLQKKVKTFNQFFLQQVAAKRPVVAGDTQAWAEGQVFFMEEAQALGLVDSVMSLESLVTRLDQSQTFQGKSGRAAFRSFNLLLAKGVSVAKQLNLSEEQAAALASGATPESLGLPTDVGEPTEEPETEAEGTGTEVSLESEQEAETVEEPSKPTEIVAFLRSELRETQTQLATTLAQLQSVKASAETSAANLTALVPVALEAVKRLQIALGQAPTPLEGQPVAAVVAAFQAAQTQFHKRFKVGQQSLDEADADDVPTDLRAQSLNIYPINQ